MFSLNAINPGDLFPSSHSKNAPPAVDKYLNASLALAFFIALAVLNEIVWRTQSTDVWVNFKVFGILPITFIFTMTQFPLIKKYQIED